MSAYCLRVAAETAAAHLLKAEVITRLGTTTNKACQCDSSRLITGSDKVSAFVLAGFFVPREGHLKGNNMTYPMLDLESEIYSAEALIDLLASQLSEHLEHMENDETGRVAAGLVNLSHERRKKLRAAYDAAHDQWRREVNK